MVGSGSSDRPSPRIDRQASRQQIVGLDLLRFAAALLVMSYHLGSMSWRAPGNPAAKIIDAPLSLPDMLPLTWFGWIGVQMFFVISGFVILFSSQGMSARDFAKHRAIRLLPCIWFSALVCSVIAASFGPESCMMVLARFTMTLAAYPVPFWIDNVYWTLNVEISFYILIFVLIRYGDVERVVTAVGCLSSVLWLVSATHLVPHFGFYLSKHIAKVLLLTDGCYFALGMIGFQIMKDGMSTKRLVVSALCVVGALCEIQEVSATEEGFLHMQVQPLVPQAVFLVSLMAFAASIRFRTSIASATARFRGVVRLLGLSTYPLYLLHTTVGGLVIHVALRMGLTDLASVMVAMALDVVFALLVTTTVEPWIGRRLRGRLDGVAAFRDHAGAAAVPSAMRVGDQAA